MQIEGPQAWCALWEAPNVYLADSVAAYETPSVGAETHGCNLLFVGEGLLFLGVVSLRQRVLIDIQVVTGKVCIRLSDVD